MKNFSFEYDVESGEFGYILSTLEGVIQYITHSKQTLQDLSSQVELFFNAIKAGDMLQLKTVYDNRVVSSSQLGLALNDGSQSPEGSGPLFKRVFYCRNWVGQGALLLAVISGNMQVLNYIMDVEKDTNLIDYMGNTALHICAEHNSSEEIVSVLIKAGIDLNIRNNKGETAFIIAVAQNNIVLAKLLASKANVDIQTDVGDTALHVAKSAEMVQLLLEMEANANIHNEDCLTPLLYHCHQGNLEVAKTLILNGLATDGVVNLRSVDMGLRTALHLCAFNGSLNLVSLLLDSLRRSSDASSPPKFDINALTIRGNTPLHGASDAGNLDLVKKLLEAGANPAHRNLQGKLASDMTSNISVRDIIEDYALFWNKPAWNGSKVAQVIRVQIVDKNVVFTIKSGTYDDHASILKVHRTLVDFGLLRSHLLLEHPESGILDMNELFSNPTWVYENVQSPKKSKSGRILRKIIRRLDKFLEYILMHPSFKTHELTWEFLAMNELEVLLFFLYE